MNISYHLLGYVKVGVDYENIAPLLNLCMQYGIPYAEFETHPDRVTLSFRQHAFIKMRKAASEHHILYTVEKRKGIPYLLEKYKYRFGIFLGIIIAIMAVYSAHRFVWDITVSGNESVTSSEVRALLSEHGFGIGSYIPHANTDRIENKIMIDSEKISWMSINIIGTVAQVQIREYKEPLKSNSVSKPSNMIATASGIVEEVRIWRGNSVVKAGDYVEKGALLISGLYDSTRKGFRYTRASGEVYARTVREIFIDIPYEYEEKRFTGDEYCNKYLNFFDYSINISKKCGKEGSLYDKIYTVENCCLPDGTQTPFSLHTERFLEYEIKTGTRDAQAAENLAYRQLEERLSELSDSAIVIEKTVIPSVRQDSFSLYCTVIVIENIAAVSEFEIDYGGIKTTQ